MKLYYQVAQSLITLFKVIINKVTYNIYRVNKQKKVANQRQLALPTSKMKRNETKWKETATIIFLNAVMFNVSFGFISV